MSIPFSRIRAPSNKSEGATLLPHPESWAQKKEPLSRHLKVRTVQFLSCYQNLIN